MSHLSPSDQRPATLPGDPNAIDSPIERFVRRRQPRWERLSGLLERTVRRPGRAPLTVEELDELIRLYRHATTDLAVARRDYPGDRVVVFLNQLVTRAYGVIYHEPPVAASRIRRFFRRELPREYRSAWPFLVAAASLLFLPYLVMFAVVVVNPESAALIIPSGMIAEIKSGRTWFASPDVERPAVASFIMTHNVQVALTALGGGMLAGVGTVGILVFNGIEFGAVSGALVAYGLGDQLIGFVSPHGFLELSVVVIAGACGLMLGRAIIWPGLATRGDALSTAGGRSVRLLVGML